MKKVHLYEVKLVDDSTQRGEIIQSDDRTVWLRLSNGQKICLLKNNIVLIKELGWQKSKN